MLRIPHFLDNQLTSQMAISLSALGTDLILLLNITFISDDIYGIGLTNLKRQFTF
jgi:hypothetical protein